MAERGGFWVIAALFLVSSQAPRNEHPSPVVRIALLPYFHPADKSGGERGIRTPGRVSPTTI